MTASFFFIETAIHVLKTANGTIIVVILFSFNYFILVRPMVRI